MIGLEWDPGPLLPAIRVALVVVGYTIGWLTKHKTPIANELIPVILMVIGTIVGTFVHGISEAEAFTFLAPSSIAELGKKIREAWATRKSEGGGGA